ncbi:MAG: Stp1/IreP family PP2C-type Ser/Thr phosphatase [Tissierellia bacterium]|nr:Stp1/IreP family PP2C-type Ser/Thr phosphatase [Tissierellia bacterium]MDD4725765.1 Stp1/IreP family PP2C-type Ser/Thr phosphatase [Tissierellia bacterium]
MIVGAVSDIGLRRENNQDSMFTSTEGDFPLFIVADGMGGHKAGDIASRMAVEGIVKYLKNNQDRINSEENIKILIREAVEYVNTEIYLESFEVPEYLGMGTTITLAYIYNSKVFVCHVGDSRAYLVINKKIKQITEDHTLVNELIKNGSITPAEAINHPQKNLITRAIGTSCDIEMDFYTINIRKDDVFILCSDGLSNMVGEDSILDVVSNNLNKNMNEICNSLVELAKENGGKDNITVIGIKFDDEVLK